MRPYERKQLLERIERDGATVGESIPERVEVGDDSIALREFVFEIRRRDTIPPGERERVQQAKRRLRRARTRRVDRIEDDDISYETGQELADSVVGIDRALSALEQLDSPDIEQEAKRQEQMDTQRWNRFLRQALGRADDQNVRGRR